MSILGKRLKLLRDKFDYSQKRVADAVGISNVQLSRYESGDRNPDPDIIAKLADFYDVTTDYLHGRTENPNGQAIEQKEYDPLDEINKLIKQFGIEDFGFFNIEEWKNFTPEDVEELKRHFEWVAHKARERNEEKK